MSADLERYLKGYVDGTGCANLPPPSSRLEKVLWKFIEKLCASSGGGACPIKYVESLDKENIMNLRDLESGIYILYGYFRPFEGSDTTTIFSNQSLVTLIKKTAGTHLQCFYPVNNQIQFAAIMVDEAAEDGYTYDNYSVYLEDVYNHIIPSSTEGSSKRFRLSVDDSGAITATEVAE